MTETATRTTELLKDGWYYLGTYFKDDKWPSSSGTVTLLVHHYEIRRGRTGLVRIYHDSDGLDFQDEEAMGEWITEHDAEELPPEADGNPQFVPAEFVAAYEEAKAG